MKKLLLLTHLAALGIGVAPGIYALPILDSHALHWGEGAVSVGTHNIGLAGRLAPGPDCITAARYRQLDYVVLVAAGLLAGTLGGIVGTGSSLVLMPILVVMFGPRQAVPIMALAAILGNLGRVLAWWRDIDWRACAAYCSTAIPGAVIGARTLLAIPPGVAEAILGVFFLALIGVRRWLAHRSLKLSLGQLALLGGPLGWLTGVVVSTGPLTVPLFTFHGLERGAFLGTEAAGSIGVYVAKVLTFQVFGALPAGVLLQGLGVGATLMAGSFIGKHVVLGLSPQAYRWLIDVLMLCSGLSLLWAAAR